MTIDPRESSMYVLSRLSEHAEKSSSVPEEDLLDSPSIWVILDDHDLVGYTKSLDKAEETITKLALELETSLRVPDVIEALVETWEGKRSVFTCDLGRFFNGGNTHVKTYSYRQTAFLE